MAAPGHSFPTQSHFIYNSAYSSGTPLFTTINPATNTPLANVHTASADDISYAVFCAAAAFSTWSCLAPVERSRILLRAVEILRSRNDEIAKVESLDTGKALCETSTVDIATGADVLEYFAGLGMGMGEGKTIQLRPDAWVYTRKEPLGVFSLVQTKQTLMNQACALALEHGISIPPRTLIFASLG